MGFLGLILVPGCMLIEPEKCIIVFQLLIFFQRGIVHVHEQLTFFHAHDGSWKHEVRVSSVGGCPD